jgi:nucleoside-diphosphate-sugar epimerase
MSEAPRTAFVTGATGFLGKNLVLRLIEAGWSVVALYRPSSDVAFFHNLPVTMKTGSILDAASLLRAIPPEADCVFHVAANTAMWSRHAVAQRHDNVEGTRNVVAAALARGARRFVHTSTWNVYGLEQGDIHEDLPQTAARSWIGYDRTKWQAEQAVKVGIDRGLPAVIVNPGHIIGRFDKQNWVTMIRLVAAGRLPGVPPGTGSIAHAAEVARAHIAAAERGRVGANYLLGGADASFREFVTEIGRILDKPTPDQVVPAYQLRLAARWQDWRGRLGGPPPEITPESAAIVCARARIVSTRAFHELGYRPPPLTDMLADCIAWLRETRTL